MRRTHRTERGFTLIESVISIVIVGVMLVAALNTLGATARARQVQANRGGGLGLARDLMTEILAARYEEPVDPPVFGRETSESANARGNWDDVDDYDGWSRSPPKSKNGPPVPDAAGWQRQVTVTYADPATLAPTGQVVDTGLKLITVTATAPNGEQTVLTGLRSRYGAGERAPAVDDTFVTWVGVELQVGPDTPRTSEGTSLLNPVDDDP